MNRRLAALALTGLFTGALALGACGKQGELERPAPLWGDKAKAEYQAQKKREQEEREAAAANGGSSTLVRPGPGDPGQPGVPARTAPIPGGPQDPGASGPPGVLPDPYARPQ